MARRVRVGVGLRALLTQLSRSRWFALNLLFLSPVFLVHNSAERQAFQVHRCGVTAASVLCFASSTSIYRAACVPGVDTGRQRRVGESQDMSAGQAGTGPCRAWSPRKRGLLAASEKAQLWHMSATHDTGHSGKGLEGSSGPSAGGVGVALTGSGGGMDLRDMVSM